ncbi:MAG: hypothetical protein ACXADB_09925 [Candidatus Hermodarchaeia archaeon]|jgi:hypothetical protein
MKIQKVIELGGGWLAAGPGQALYRLDGQVGYNADGHTDHVFISSIVAMDHGGPECFIFPADPSGNILNYGELPGSQRGTLDHAVVIAAAGWTLTEEKIK